MHQFALVGNGPMANRGCEAISVATRMMLEQEFGACRFLLAGFDKDSDYQLPANVRRVHLPYDRPRWSEGWWKYRARRLVKRPDDVSDVLGPLKGQISGLDAVLSVGGDGYSIDFGHQIIDRLVCLDKYFLSRGIPTVIWGASIGPFTYEPEFEQLMVDHLRRIDLIMVRELESFQYLVGLGVTGNVQFAPDPAFTLAAERPSLSEPIEEAIAGECVGLNLSPVLAKYTAGGDLASWIGQAVELTEHLAAAVDLPLLLVPHVCGRNAAAHIDDWSLMDSVQRRLQPSLQQRVLLLPPSLTCQQLKWVIKQTQVFVGARTHATIAALSSMVPCISLAYSRKAWGINKMVFGHTEWVLPPESLGPKLLSDRVKSLLRDRDVTRRQLTSVVPGIVQSAYGATTRLRAAISQ